MTTFNLDPSDHVHVEHTDDGVTIRFDGETLGFMQTADGLSITNDWNSRHFTLGFDENSLFYHLTREDVDDRRSGKNALSHEEFIAELYGYMRSLATAVPEDHLDLDFVGKVDFSEIRGYLEDKGVITNTADGFQIDPDRKAEVETELNDNPTARGELYQRVLDPVPFEEATSTSKSEHVYAYPMEEALYVLVNYPDQTIGVATVDMLLNFTEIAGGSQLVDHAIRSVGEES
ncbi:hypothetical protein ACFQJ5_19250 [Halomicroarcula sp. GCM10025324]|uniref:hypothetical protein n=1 Tax=Halomicroarcula sp. GCM10025324 TaxID=3252667 RepID=UPI00361C5BA6